MTRATTAFATLAIAIAASPRSALAEPARAVGAPPSTAAEPAHAVAPSAPTAAEPARASSPPPTTASPRPAWRRPVPGAISRRFAYSSAERFVAGRHRGVDLAARPGATVRAACSGRVVFAGRDVVTLRCGGWRVTHLPLAALAVRSGQRVSSGTRLGTLAASGEHAGLHLGVRRAGDRFGYVDPLEFLGGPNPPVAIPAPRTGPETRVRERPPGPAPRTGPEMRVRETPPRPAPQTGPATRVRERPPRELVRLPPSPAPPARVRVPSERPPAPWPVWLGLALALLGAVGGGIRVRARRKRLLADPVAS